MPARSFGRSRWSLGVLGVAVVACGCRGRPSSADLPPTTVEAPPAGSAFGPTIANAGQPPGPPPPGMVWIPGGEFSMGADGELPDTRPIHRVYVAGCWMD